MYAPLHLYCSALGSSEVDDGICSGASTFEMSRVYVNWLSALGSMTLAGTRFGLNTFAGGDGFDGDGLTTFDGDGLTTFAGGGLSTRCAD